MEYSLSREIILDMLDKRGIFPVTPCRKPAWLKSCHGGSQWGDASKARGTLICSSGEILQGSQALFWQAHQTLFINPGLGYPLDCIALAEKWLAVFYVFSVSAETSFGTLRLPVQLWKHRVHINFGAPKGAVGEGARDPESEPEVCLAS